MAKKPPKKGGGWFERAVPTQTPTGIRNVAPKHCKVASKKRTEAVLRVPMQKAKPRGYYTHETIMKDIQVAMIQMGHFPTSQELKYNHFPTVAELKDEGRQDLISQITSHGGTNKFRELMGYPISQYDEYYLSETTL